MEDPRLCRENGISRLDVGIKQDHYEKPCIGGHQREASGPDSPHFNIIQYLSMNMAVLKPNGSHERPRNVAGSYVIQVFLDQEQIPTLTKLALPSSNRPSLPC